MAVDVVGFKAGQRAVWAAGDYSSIAELIQPAADVVIEQVGVGEGESLLDVATGTGNVAIPAAQLGARVTGLDITPELLEIARGRAAGAGVEIEFVEGDAEELPFENGSFDRVTSVFGVMFAPRHERAAQELVRVTAPGGTFAVTAWTPEGLNGQMFRTVGQHMPPPDPELKPPVSWGVEEYVRELFADQPVELQIEQRSVTFEEASPEAMLATMEDKLGPVLLARQALEPQGKWQALRDQLLELEKSFNTAGDAGFSAKADYLLTVGRVAV